MNIINMMTDNFDVKLGLRENFKTTWKYTILRDVFTWLLIKYLIEWFRNLKANRNRRHFQPCIEHSILNTEIPLSSTWPDRTRVSAASFNSFWDFAFELRRERSRCYTSYSPSQRCRMRVTNSTRLFSPG
jgi:hypothetical protein